jgi:serine/threonine protein kinase
LNPNRIHLIAFYSLINIQKEFSVRNGLRMKHVLQIGQQLLRRIKALHSLNYVHGDIKPANIMFGRGIKKNTLYLIDFGMTKIESDPFDTRVDESIYEKKNLDFSVIVRQNMLHTFIRYY